MGQTAIVTPQIIDSTSIGRDLLTAVDQASAQSIIGVTGVDTAGDYTWTGDHTFDNGLSTDAITSTSLTSTYASAGSHTYTFGVNPKYFMNATNFRPATSDEDIALGIDGRRWGSVASVDGNFSGNLVSEVGGSYKLYQLGTEGDTDTSYLEIANNGTNFQLYAKATGAGTEKNIAIGTSDTSIGVNPAGQVIFRSAGAYKMDLLSSGIRVWDDIFPLTNNTSNVGTSASRWANVYSVDGSFSGNLTSEVGGSYKLYNLGTEGDTDTEYLSINNQVVQTQDSYVIEPKATGSGTDSRSIYLMGPSGRTGGHLLADRFSNISLLYGSTSKVGVGNGYVQIKGDVFPITDNAETLGKASNRWSETYSVDGDFSGDVVVGGEVSTSKVKDDSGSGGFLQLTASQAQLGGNGTVAMTATAFNVTFDKNILFNTTTAQIGSTTGNRLFRLNTQHIDASGDVVMAANVDFTGLPTSDPAVAGRLWNDGGTMKISAG